MLKCIVSVLPYESLLWLKWAVWTRLGRRQENAAWENPMTKKTSPVFVLLRFKPLLITVEQKNKTHLQKGGLASNDAFISAYLNSLTTAIKAKIQSAGKAAALVRSSPLSA